MNLLARLFGGGDTQEKIIDGVMAGADALVFTPEEKSKANLELLKLRIEWAKATTSSRLARRVIAFMVIGVYLLLLLCATVLGVLGFDEQSRFVFEVIADALVQPVSIIIGFYFASQVFGKAK